MVVYLDNSATTRPYDQVIDIMGEVQRDFFGNPSSLHTLGMAAEKHVREARKVLASSMGAGEGEVYFNSGGTEADNTAVMGAAELRRRKANKIITTAVEHPAVLEPVRRLAARGFEVEYIGVDKNCRLNMKQLEGALTEGTALISVMTVNNETGTVMPIEEIAALKDRFNREKGAKILFHTDAVQAFGKLHISVNGNFKGVDLISLSGHKLHGPKGIGGLYVREGLNLPPFMVGGGQERGMRSGTENTAAIAGLAKAVEIAFGSLEERMKTVERVRSLLLEGIKAEISDVIINSPERDACPSVLSVSFLGTRGEVLLHTLEQEGIFLSTGSACSSNKKGQSHVLKAMGLSPKEIEGTLRFSFSDFNTVSEIEYALDKVKNAVKRFRRLGSFR